jgi:hypothetical protein
MKMYGGSGYIIRFFLIWAIVGGEWSASHSGRFTPPWGEGPRYPLDRRLGGPQSRSRRRGEEIFFTIPGLELRPHDHAARRELLYRLRYPSSNMAISTEISSTECNVKVKFSPLQALEALRVVRG